MTCFWNDHLMTMKMMSMELECLIKRLLSVANVWRVMEAPGLIFEQQWNNDPGRGSWSQADYTRSVLGSSPFPFFGFLQVCDFFEPL